MRYNLITVLGPTATGKTRLAAKLANEFNGEIISADSRQVYRGMDIGTGKDLKDYIVGGEEIRYYLIDIVSPEQEFNLFEFKKEFTKAFEEINSRKKIPFLAGGTGLYLSSVIQNYKLKEADFSGESIDNLKLKEEEELKEQLRKLRPSLHNTTDLTDKERIIKAIIIAKGSEAPAGRTFIEINSLNIGIMPERKVIKDRITQRLKIRLQNGMIEEVKSLLESGISYGKLDYFGLEYRFIAGFLKGELNYNDMFQKLNSAIHKFAKRQATWFRKMEREGIKIYWLDSPDFNKAKEIINLHYFNDK